MNNSLVATPQVTEDQGAIILPFRRMHRPQAKLPLDVLVQQCCIVCGSFGCVVRFVTHPENGGKETGDNLLPVCESHSRWPLLDLYQTCQDVQKWLIEHDRIDAILLIENAITRRILNGKKANRQTKR